MIKKIIFTILAIAAMLAPQMVKADEWRTHPTYDGNIERIIDTRDFTYLLSLNQPYVVGTTDNGYHSLSLYRYDKGADELEWINTDSGLSENVVANAAYNREKRYLVAVYDNGNIDLIYDDGTVMNVPGLMLAGAEFSRNVNDISFSAPDNEIFLATDFGYFVIDDKTAEVKYTRNLHKKVDSLSRIGDKVLLISQGNVYAGDCDAHKFEEFAVYGNFEDPKGIYHLSDSKSLIRFKDGWNGMLHCVETDGSGNLSDYPMINTMFRSVENTESGVLVSGYFDIWNIAETGTVSHLSLPETDHYANVGHWSGDRYLFGRGRDGVLQMRAKDGGWEQTGVLPVPNASNVYKSDADNMVYHPKYGMLVRNHGINHSFSSQWVYTTDLISGLKSLTWTPLSAAYRANSDAFIQWNPRGVAVDPNNQDHVYSGSYTHGLMRLDLADPSKSLRVGRKGDAAAGMPGYVGALEDQSYDLWSVIATPYFDSYGNLWTCWSPYDETPSSGVEFWLWNPADRAASVDAASFRMPRRQVIAGLKATSNQKLMPLRASSNKNLLIYGSGGWGEGIVIFNHNGNPESLTSADRADITSFYDQYGSKIEYSYLRSLIEETSTGRVWACTDKGVFYFNPIETMQTGGKAYRIKVARNDGTNLADYLLDGISVNDMVTDNSGRRWFATAGGGIVITSADGAEVLKSYTTDNSEIPDNTVYGLCYYPENHSMMVSTDKGLAELFLSTATGGSSSSNVKIYPNPVRPDYFGYVTIEGLADNALVKIVDAAGNLIKEVGFAAGGEITWDVTNLNQKRVPGGVYYVLASGAPDSDSFSARGKILVVN